MQFTASQIATLLQGTVEGDPNATVSRLSKIEEGGPGSLSFLANPAYAQYVHGTTASVVIIGNAFELTGPVKTTLVRVADAQSAFAKVLAMYNTIKLDKKGISPQAVIEAGATYGDNCYIGPLAFIGVNVKLGSNVRIYPHVYIGDNVSFFAWVTRLGATSISVHIEVEAERFQPYGKVVPVTAADVVYVSVDRTGQKTTVVRPGETR